MLNGAASRTAVFAVAAGIALTLLVAPGSTLARRRAVPAGASERATVRTAA
ncbi:hypothetical protein ACSDR0_38595 [Streptosporangium sp. G11]|uniref:hypothetical protein n=1 Tax=Streptosporangium sp. G11 TaxID=3436926 RepID=UPI003EB8C90E